MFLNLNFFTSSLLAQHYSGNCLLTLFILLVVYSFLIPAIKLGSIRRPHVRVKMGLDKILVISLTLNFYIGYDSVSFIYRQIQFIIFLFLVIFVADKFEILWPKNYYFNQAKSWKLQNWEFPFWCKISNGKSLFLFIYFIFFLFINY